MDKFLSACEKIQQVNPQNPSSPENDNKIDEDIEAVSYDTTKRCHEKIKKEKED